MRRIIVLVTTMALTVLVASGVAWAVNKIGTNGPDTLIGTNKADNLLGRGGNDVLFSLDGRDNLLGWPGRDAVLGENESDRHSSGDKNLMGGRGNDYVVAGQGCDIALGEGGNDLLVDGNFREFSHDRVSGGSGNDVFLVYHVPAFKDIIVCGGGFDRVLADRKDLVVRDCERVRLVHGSLEEVVQQDQQFISSIPQSFFEGLNFP